jgi:tRNA-dihydrouridine synthase A
MRQITKCTLLYTEMITTNAIIHGDRDFLLGYNKEEHPIAFQIGGSTTKDMVECAKIIEDFGYDEININCGCPSQRVKKGQFGACLMDSPQLVAENLNQMQNVVKIPVTVKNRIGIDENDSYEDLFNFTSIIKDAGCKTFIIHARKAILGGLSPKQNREIPKLKPEFVYNIKKDFPDLEIIFNGNIQSLQEAKEKLNHVDGIMIGRLAYGQPYLMSEADNLIYNQNTPIIDRIEIIENMLPYIEEEIKKGTKMHNIVKHMIGLFHGQPNGKAWRRFISENIFQKEANVNILKEALSIIK